LIVEKQMPMMSNDPTIPDEPIIAKDDLLQPATIKAGDTRPQPQQSDGDATQPPLAKAPTGGLPPVTKPPRPTKPPLKAEEVPSEAEEAMSTGRDPIYPMGVLFLKNPGIDAYMGWQQDLEVDADSKERSAVRRFVIETKGVSSEPVKSGDVIFLKTMQHTFVDIDPADDKVRVRWPDQGDWQRILIEKEGSHSPPCEEGYKLDADGEICLAQHGTPVYVGDTVHLKAVQTGFYLVAFDSGEVVAKSIAPSSQTRWKTETENLEKDTHHLSQYPPGWSYDHEPEATGEGCEMSAIRGVLARIPEGGEMCRKRVVDFYCKNWPSQVRKRMPRTEPLQADGGTCPSNLHDRTSGMMPSTYNELDPPRFKNGRTHAMVGYIIFATPDMATVKQLKGLLHEIQEPQNAYVVHIDAKQPRHVQEIIAELPQAPNVHYISTRNITWGGFTLLQAELDALRELLSMGIDWDMVINLSANAYPIKPKREIARRLALHGDVNHLEIFFQLDQFVEARGIRYWFVECTDVHRVFRLKAPGTTAEWRPLPQGIEVYAGSQWFMLTRPFVEFVMGCLTDTRPGDEKHCTLVRDFYEYCRFSLLSDEMFFQTLIMNGPFCKRVGSGSMHWVAWRPPPPNAPACLHGDVVDWCGVSPSLVWPQDVSRMGAAHQLYARKFDDTDRKSKYAKEKLKAEILHPPQADDQIGNPEDYEKHAN